MLFECQYSLFPPQCDTYSWGSVLSYIMFAPLQNLMVFIYSSNCSEFIINKKKMVALPLYQSNLITDANTHPISDIGVTVVNLNILEVYTNWGKWLLTELINLH